MVTQTERKRFFEFREEVLKFCEIHKFSEIHTEHLWMFIRSHTQGYMGRKFFDEKIKLNYYKYWIKMLIGGGILEETKKVGFLKVNRPGGYEGE